jgi:hypothetical protein
MITRCFGMIVAITLMSSVGLAEAKPKPPTPPPATMPVAGDMLDLAGGPGWGKLDWLYDVPAANDAAGKIVIHWFCTTKVKECSDDLARMIGLRDAGHAYIVAYINGTKADAKKLDPIRESEGVGRGTVAYGAGVTKLAKALGITGAAAIVVNTDGKVALISSSTNPDQLDARDNKVGELAKAIHTFTTSVEPVKPVKVGDKFKLELSIKLASWLTYAQPIELTIQAPQAISCDARTLSGDQLRPEGQILKATVTCSAPRGSYEATGKIHFEYRLPTKETGIGEDGAKWKIDVSP